MGTKAARSVPASGKDVSKEQTIASARLAYFGSDVLSAYYRMQQPLMAIRVAYDGAADVAAGGSEDYPHAFSAPAPPVFVWV